MSQGFLTALTLTSDQKMSWLQYGWSQVRSLALPDLVRQPAVAGHPRSKSCAEACGKTTTCSPTKRPAAAAGAWPGLRSNRTKPDRSPPALLQTTVAEILPDFLQPGGREVCLPTPNGGPHWLFRVGCVLTLVTFTTPSPEAEASKPRILTARKSSLPPPSASTWRHCLAFGAQKRSRKHPGLFLLEIVT